MPDLKSEVIAALGSTAREQKPTDPASAGGAPAADATPAWATDLMSRLDRIERGQAAAKSEPAPDPLADALRSLATPEKTAPGYRSPGAPNGGPRSPEDVPATQWTQDDIARMRADGSFKKALDRFGRSLGGGGGVFQKRMPRM